MKNNKFIQMITAMFLLVVFATCVSTSALAADVPVYLLYYGDGNSGSIYTASYISDGTTDHLITVADVATLESQGVSASLIGVSGQNEVSYLGTSGSLAYYSCSALESVTSMKLGSEFTSTASICALENPQGTDLEFNSYSLNIDDSWVSGDGCIYTTQSEAPNTWYWGAPVLNSSGMTVGLLSGTASGNMAIVPLIDPSGVVGSGSTGDLSLAGENGNVENGNNQNNNADQNNNGEDSNTDTTNTNSWNWFPFVMIGAAAVFGFYLKNKKNGENGNQENDNGGADGTKGLDLEPEYVAGTAPVAAAAPAVWQIRGVGGPMDGKVFAISGTLRLGRGSRCDVVFPQSAAGVSGEHCQLSVVDGRAVLRDLQSSYGTYLSKRVKLEPHVDYHLQSGDEFTLAQGGQTFRLERAGESPRKSGPSVRSASGNRTFYADNHGRLAFGRSERCQVRFRQEDAGISGSHCVLYRDEKGLVLMDSGSSNGTFFEGGQRLKPNVPYHVKKGTSFFLASPKYTFVITDD